MKKQLLALVLVLGGWFYSQAQWVSIPDTNFGTWLSNNGYTQCLQGNSTFGWQMDTTCTDILNEDTLTFYQTNIVDLTGVTYFVNLKYLSCGGPALQFIPTLPPVLEVFSSYNNEVMVLPDLPTTLRVFVCSQTPVSFLPALPDSLEVLSCQENPDIWSLPALPPNLKHMNLYNCRITSLPALNNKIESIDADYNLLTCIPSLPNSLKLLNCSHNPLISLPSLNNLVELYCFDDSLSILPSLPSSLRFLDVALNKLTNLPALPANLKTLYCQGNLLTAIPDLPAGLQLFSFHANPGLSCLPWLPAGIANIYLYGTNITCIPNQPPQLMNNIPVCTAGNSNGCALLPAIGGSVFIDKDSDCVYGAGDVGVILPKVMLFSNGQLITQYAENYNGKYSFTVPAGTYQVALDSNDLPIEIVCPDTGCYKVTLTSADSVRDALDFAIQCPAGYDVGVYSVNRESGIFRPANYATVRLEAGDLSFLYSLSCAAGISGELQIIISGQAQYVGPATGALVPLVNGNTVKYQISDFGLVHEETDFRFVVQTDTTAQIGKDICFKINVMPVINDNKPENNTLTYCFPVVNSYDPNEKEVSPVSEIDSSSSWLTYTVRFQNTGNAPAQNVMIMDTLNNNIDEKTFRLLTYSYPPLTTLTGSAVRFNFPNINLPDSNTNEPLSHGYVQYKVKLKDNLPVGTQIDNTAFIYFDFNAPVVTNTTTNTITANTSVQSISSDLAKVILYPNPTQSMLYIQTENMQANKIAVYNAEGRKVAEQRYTSPLDVTTWQKGVYIIELKTVDGNLVRNRFVKM